MIDSQSISVQPGTAVSLAVAASVANLGSGFDSIGIALGIYDDLEARVVEDGFRVHISGEGGENLPRNRENIVIQGVLDACAAGGVGVPGLELRCTNRIPQARGLGSSAAAYTAGLGLGAQLVATERPPLSVDTLINLGGVREGHADNSSASILGGLVISWYGDGGYHATKVALDPRISITVCIPQETGYTHHARTLLPHQVPLKDAVFNLSRSALLIHALSQDPDLLFSATEDALHQSYRAHDQPLSTQVLQTLRKEWKLAAAIGGAGPTVVILHELELPEQAKKCISELGFTVVSAGIGAGLPLG